MTSRAQIEETIRLLYIARVKGDLDGTLRDIADDAVFDLNAAYWKSIVTRRFCCSG